MQHALLSTPVAPDAGALVRCIRREGTPRRVHYIELFLDPEVQEAVCDRFGLTDGLDRGDSGFDLKRQVILQRFLGYDYVRGGLEGMDWPFNRTQTEDTAAIRRTGGRSFVDESRGPVTNWQEFEAYPWPDPARASTRMLDWYEKNLPDDMCVICSGGFAHFAEHLTWLMGYETLCYALFDDRALVKAIADRLLQIYRVALRRILAYERVKLVWGSDDMGYRGGTLISPDDTREFILPGHRLMAQMAHDRGLPYLLHSCGNLAAIMPDLLDDVKIDAKHSFEDTVETVPEVKKTYGQRIALLGGIDVDFLCRADEAAIRRRVRETLEVCMPGGGYCLGTGNSVTNYIPLESYLVMLDEGRRFAA